MSTNTNVVINKYLAPMAKSFLNTVAKDVVSSYGESAITDYLVDAAGKKIESALLCSAQGPFAKLICE